MTVLYPTGLHIDCLTYPTVIHYCSGLSYIVFCRCNGTCTSIKSRRSNNLCEIVGYKTVTYMTVGNKTVGYKPVKYMTYISTVSHARRCSGTCTSIKSRRSNAPQTRLSYMCLSYTRLSYTRLSYTRLSYILTVLYPRYFAGAAELARASSLVARTF